MSLGRTLLLKAFCVASLGGKSCFCLSFLKQDISSEKGFFVRPLLVEKAAFVLSFLEQDTSSEKGFFVRPLLVEKAAFVLSFLEQDTSSEKGFFVRPLLVEKAAFVLSFLEQDTSSEKGFLCSFTWWKKLLLSSLFLNRIPLLKKAFCAASLSGKSCFCPLFS